jgi:SAM-dependent methyltransferase
VELVVTIAARFDAAARLVADHRDLLDARPGAAGAGAPREGGDDDAPAVPHVLVTRGWASFLLELTDGELDALEIAGHDATWPAETPPSLVALAEEARAVCALPMLATPLLSPPAIDAPPARRLETPRKRAQIEAFARVIVPLATDAERIIDVGSGHGHLTRDIAERIARPVVGLERQPSLAARARSLPSTASPSFAVTDVLREGLTLVAADCVIGLHACGELGDAMVESAAASGAALALVGCCLQKRRASSRALLCATAAAEAGYVDALRLPRDLLGLSNLTARDDGVEASRAANLAGRERRLALHRLLCLDGGARGLRLGAEIEGLNRRAAQRDLPTLAARAFAIRGRALPSSAAVEEAAAWARIEHARARRLSLPRALLARVLEVLVLLDRARYLELHARDVTIGLLFPANVSARNLVLASPSRQGTVTSAAMGKTATYSL